MFGYNNTQVYKLLFPLEVNNIMPYAQQVVLIITILLNKIIPTQ